MRRKYRTTVTTSADGRWNWRVEVAVTDASGLAGPWKLLADAQFAPNLATALNEMNHAILRDDVMPKERLG